MFLESGKPTKLWRKKYLEKTWSSFTSFSMVCSDLAPVD
jgi:hypothetical protein